MPDPKVGVRPSFLRGWVQGGGERSEAGPRRPEEAPGTAAQPAREAFTFFGSAAGQAICLNNPKENHLAKLLSF